MAKIFEYMGCDGPSSTKNNWFLINYWFKLSFDASNYALAPVSWMRAGLWEGRDVEIKPRHTVKQTYGQMMGDIKSFNALCILNLSLWEETCGNKDMRIVVNEPSETIVHRKVDGTLSGTFYPGTVNVFEEEAPCLINGDDFVAFAPRSIADLHMKKGKDFGFVFSIGKSYRNRKLAVINSKPFWMNYNRRNKSYKLVELQLLRHELVMKPLKDVPFEGQIDMVTDVSDYQGGARLRREMLGFFLRQRKNEISQRIGKSNANLFMKRIDGGLGATPRPGLVIGYSRHQRTIQRWNQFCVYNGFPNKSMVIIQDWWKVIKKEGNKILTCDPRTRNPLMGLIASYTTTKDTRDVARDDWLANLSKVRINGRGYFRSKWTRIFLKRRERSLLDKKREYGTGCREIDLREEIEDLEFQGYLDEGFVRNKVFEIQHIPPDLPL
jgi:hypothetical protein